jgi:hypothetical protein
MAQAASAAAAAPGSRGRLRLVSVDLADGSEPDADLRPALARARVFEEIIRDNLDLGRPASSATGLRPGGLTWPAHCQFPFLKRSDPWSRVGGLKPEQTASEQP